MISSFWRTLTSSVYHPHYYKEVLEGGRMHTASFVFLFSLCAACVSLLFVVPAAQSVRGALERAPAFVNEVYPETLVLTLAHGELSVKGAEEPVTIPLGSLSPLFDAEKKYEHALPPVTALVRIDTVTPYTPKAHAESGAFVWAGKTFMTVQQRGEKQVYEYVEMTKNEKEPVVLTKTEVDRAAQLVKSGAGYILPSAIVGALFLVTLLYACGMVVFGYGIGLLLLCGIWVGRRIGAYDGDVVSYRALVRSAIVAGTLPSLVMMVSWFTPVAISYGVYTLAVLLIIVVNIRGAR